MARKFIITATSFHLGNVNLHSELKGEEPVIGGGRWHTQGEKKVLYLWGLSTDYGYAEPEAIKAVIGNSWLSASFSDYVVMHSPVLTVELPAMETFTELLTLPNFSHV